MLNVGWSYFILKVAYQAMFANGTLANDARSDDSSSDNDDNKVNNDNDDNNVIDDNSDRKTVKKMQ